MALLAFTPSVQLAVSSSPGKGVASFAKESLPKSQNDSKRSGLTATALLPLGLIVFRTRQRLCALGGTSVGSRCETSRGLRMRGVLVRLSLSDDDRPSKSDDLESGQQVVMKKRTSEETAEEAMLRLSQEINDALELDDAPRVAKAQREMMKVQLEKPAAACRHLIHEDCRSATALLRLGESVHVSSRLRAVKKLGRWLRWPQGANKELVPFATVLEGILWALRSEPEVAWAGQCALFHAVRCSDSHRKSVRDTTRGTIIRLLLKEPTPFPICLPQITERMAEAYDAAVRTPAVRDFLWQLKSVTLVDPGYGTDMENYELDLFDGFASLLGRSFHSLQKLQVVGFEDCAMMLILPHLNMPRLRSMQIIGACQIQASQKAVIEVLQRHCLHLDELELNVWIDMLSQDDPLDHIESLPKVKSLALRAPPLPVSWERIAKMCPVLEELTLLYDQDFAMNCHEVLEECGQKDDHLEMLDKHTLWVYRDAVVFARELHANGFQQLSRLCPRLKTLRIAIADNSYGYDITPAKDRLAVSWRRETPNGRFRRNATENNATRATLQARSEALPHRPLFWVEEDDDDDDDFDDEGYDLHLMEADTRGPGYRVMLQVLRLFDDPSLEAELGLTGF